MTSQQAPERTTADRLDALERENRSLRRTLTQRTWAGVAAITLLYVVNMGAGKVMGGPKAAAKVVTADVMAAGSFVIRDEKGKTRGGFGCLPGQLPSLTLIDEKGRKRLSLMLSDDGQPIVALVGPEGSAQVIIAANESKAGISLLDKDKVRGKFMVDAEGNTAVFVTDEAEAGRRVRP